MQSELGRSALCTHSFTTQGCWWHESRAPVRPGHKTAAMPLQGPHLTSGRTHASKVPRDLSRSLGCLLRETRWLFRSHTSAPPHVTCMSLTATPQPTFCWPWCWPRNGSAKPWQGGSLHTPSCYRDQKEGFSIKGKREREREPKIPLHLIKKVNIRAI